MWTTSPPYILLPSAVTGQKCITPNDKQCIWAGPRQRNDYVGIIIWVRNIFRLLVDDVLWKQQQMHHVQLNLWYCIRIHRHERYCCLDGNPWLSLFSNVSCCCRQSHNWNACLFTARRCTLNQYLRLCDWVNTISLFCFIRRALLSDRIYFLSFFFFFWLHTFTLSPIVIYNYFAHILYWRSSVIWTSCQWICIQEQNYLKRFTKFCTLLWKISYNFLSTVRC